MTLNDDNGGGGSSGDSTDPMKTPGSVRVLIVDPSSDGGALRGQVDAIAGVRVVDTVSQASALADAMSKHSADLVVVNLDVSAAESIASVSAAKAANPATEFLAVASTSDSNLILTAIRSGFSDTIRLPEESDRLLSVVSALRHRTVDRSSAGQIISVIGSAGGVGCTTLAVNLAVELAEKCGEDVALVDLDFHFGHVAMLLDLEIQHSIADLCGASKTLDERVVHKAAMRHQTGVNVIPRPRDFEETADLSADCCTPLLELLRRSYPYVVLDGPTRADQTGRCVLDMADWNLLVVQPLVTSARNAKRILQALTKYDFDPAGIQVVCNRSGGGLSHLNVQRLEKSLGHKIVACIPDDWTSVSAAINLGEPLAVNAPKSKAREAIRALSELICGGADGGQDGRGGGLFSRIFGGGKSGGTGEASD